MSTELFSTQEHSDREVVQMMVSLVLRCSKNKNTRRVYAHKIKAFAEWMLSVKHARLNRLVVQDYMEFLEFDKIYNLSTRNVILSAIRALAREVHAHGLIDSDTLHGILSVKGQKPRGSRSGTWLSAQEAYELVSAPNPATPRGLRDRAILAVGIGCGLRRSEIVSLTYGHIHFEKDTQGIEWAVFRDILGKGNRYRSVPMPDWTYAAVMAWALAAGDAVQGQDGRFRFVNRTRPIFRRIHWRGQIEYTEPLSDQAVYYVLNKYAARAFADSKALDAAQSGKQAVMAPHDLRRTYARLSKQGGAPLDQIQVTLGHESIATTERYLNTQLDLDQAPARFIELGGEG